MKQTGRAGSPNEPLDRGTFTVVNRAAGLLPRLTVALVGTALIAGAAGFFGGVFTGILMCALMGLAPL